MPLFSPKSQTKAVYFQDVSSGSSETKESTLSWGRSTAPWLLTYKVQDGFLKHVDMCLSAVVIFIFAGNRKWTDISLSWFFVVILCSCDIRKGVYVRMCACSIARSSLLAGTVGTSSRSRLTRARETERQFQWFWVRCGRRSPFYEKGKEHFRSISQSGCPLALCWFNGLAHAE